MSCRFQLPIDSSYAAVETDFLLDHRDGKEEDAMVVRDGIGVVM